jgi:uncharacterized protein YjiK
MYSIYKSRLFYFIAVLLSSCAQTENPATPVRFYNFSVADNKIELQQKLTEVSGLSFINKDTIALIQDEDGTLFFLDVNSKKIVKKISFSKDGDFEDLKILGDTAYILRSDGKLYEVLNIMSEEFRTVNKINTRLSAKNDTEGLCHDIKNNRLLIACKASPGEDASYKNKKAVYSFDLNSRSLSEKPIALIDVKEVEKKSHSSGFNSFVQKFAAFFSPANNNNYFQPSGISIHPVTGEIYIISAVGNLLVVMDPNGTLNDVIKLPESLYRQPEGIAFDNDANLYISNEGKQGKGNIIVLKYQPDS